MPPRPSRRLLIGAEATLLLRANASNRGEGAFEAELRVLLPPGTHYQAARSSIPVGARRGSHAAMGGHHSSCGCLVVMGAEGGHLGPCTSPGWLVRGGGSVSVTSPCPNPTGAGETELQPQEGERDPRGAL